MDKQFEEPVIEDESGKVYHTDFAGRPSASQLVQTLWTVVRSVVDHV